VRQSRLVCLSDIHAHKMMMQRVRRNPAGNLQDGDFSPRLKLLAFFFYFLLTFAAVRGWMYIIKTENVYYETAAAFATMLALSTLYYFYSKVAARHRQRMEEIRNSGTAPPVLTMADIEAARMRLQLRRQYGENLDFMLHGGPGLTPETISTVLHHFTYEGAIHQTRTSEYRESQEIDLERGEAPSDRPSKIKRFSDECAVCLSDFADGDSLTALPCGHVYHRSCVTSWLVSRNLCPMCKTVAVQMTDLAAALAVPGANTASTVLSPPEFTALPPLPVPTATPPLPMGATGQELSNSSSNSNTISDRRWRPPLTRWHSYSGPSGPVGNLFGHSSSTSRGEGGGGTGSARTNSRGGVVMFEPIEDVDSPRSDVSEPALAPDVATVHRAPSPPVDVSPDGWYFTRARTGSEGPPQGGRVRSGSDVVGAFRPRSLSGEPAGGGVAVHRALSVNDLSDLQPLEDNIE
jgi:hypothetical protein